MRFKKLSYVTGSLPNRSLAFTLAEMMITLAIIAIVIAVVLNMSGLKKRETLQAAVDQVKVDLMATRSRAVSRLRTQRLKMVSNTQYFFEEWDGAAWVNSATGTKNLPASTTFRTYDLTNKSISLEFNTNGLMNFNGQDPSPFVTLILAPGIDRKGLYIGVGGAITVGTGAADAL